MILSGQPSIREVVTFPAVRPTRPKRPDEVEDYREGKERLHFDDW